ncbi:hypothetical protein [Pectinatus frisingensis]|uniref:hypothetical protein n=2 Tax=Pectinatus frisingensis TaxID=865 RepID=UPI0018C81D5E|nr:hypothetical protein [Pectinatus frisingensis]
MVNNVHKALDIAGFIPGIGSFSEGANSLLYAFQGEKGEAALAALSAIPGIKAVKVLKDGIQYLKIIPESGEAGKALKELYDVEKTAGNTGDVIEVTAESGKDAGKIPWNSWTDYEKVTITINGEVQTYAKVGDRLYSKHAVDRMQPSGNRYGSSITQAGGDYGRSVAPEYIEQVIKEVKPVLQENGNLSYTSGSLQVITNQQGAVVTIITK